MSYEATNLIAGKPEPKFLLPNATVDSAISALLDHNERFLPVVKDEQTKTPVGLLTSDSIATAMRNFGDGVEAMRVIDVADKITTYRETAEVAEFFADVQKIGAVAIVDKADRLINIITVHDTSDYFHALAYDMILLEDIEKSLRDHIEAAYTDPQTGKVHEQQLKSAITQATGRDKPFEQLTLAESTQLFCHPRTWSNYGKKHFSVTPKALSNLLNMVREIRNPWAHFRGNPTPAQRKQLKFAQQWFKRNDPVYPTHTFDVVKTIPATEIKELAVTPAEPTVPFIEEAAESDSKYARLAIFLSTQPTDTEQLQMTFNEVEVILGFALPQSARDHRAWWANDAMSHSWSKDWLDADWRVASVNMSEQTVRFARIRERQKAYIDFFSALINRLRQEPGFANLQTMPDGVNWYWTRGVTVYDRSVASFTYSFGRGGIFRVELYIDTGEGTLNKRLFDGLWVQKEVIEAEFGHELSWQRLNNRRASRIAYHFHAHITDSEAELAELRQKAIPTMVNYVKVMQPRAEAVGKDVLNTLTTKFLYR